MNIAAYQEKEVTASVQETGRLRELAYYYAAAGKMQALRDLQAKMPAEHEDAVFLKILDLALAPERLNSVLEPALAEPDPWCAYTVIKALLRQDRLMDAVTATQTRADRFPNDMTGLNLTIKYCLRHEHWDMAKQLAAASLDANSEQEDVRRLLTMAQHQERYPVELYLDILPRPLRLAFYVPIYNVEAYIEGALQGVFRQSYPLHECLAINDGTEDNSMALVVRFPVRVIEHEHNRGLAAARNTAFNHAEADYVGAVDSDAYPDLAFSRLLMMEFENGMEALAGAGGNLIELYDNTPADRWRKRHLAQQGFRPCRTINPDFLYGSNTIFNRAAVVSAGGYDERYRTNNEDVDLCRRLKTQGRLLLHYPEAKAYHLRRDTLESVLRMRWNWMQWHYREDEKFKNEASYVRYFRDMLGQMMNLLEKDIQEQEYDLLYLDFLMYFYDVLCGINYGVAEGVFNAADGRAMQLHLIANIGLLDQRFGGQLREKMAHDLIRIVQPANKEQQPTPGFGALFAPFLSDLRAFLSDIPESFYQVISK